MAFKSLALTLLLAVASFTLAEWSESSLEKHVDSLQIGSDFSPLILGSFYANVMLRRVAFAVSPDGSSAWAAYEDASGTSVHVVPIDLDTFGSAGDEITITGYEAGGLVAFDDGFALMSHKNITDPKPAFFVPFVTRYQNGKQSWSTNIGGPDVAEWLNGGTMNNFYNLANGGNMNGELAYASGIDTLGAYYRAEFFNTQIDPTTMMHGGDAQVYVDATSGALTDTPWGAGSAQRCGHNYGIGFAAAPEIPFATVCTEDAGEVWLVGNSSDALADLGTGGTTFGSMISSEYSTIFASQSFGDSTGGYNNLIELGSSGAYMTVWAHRGASDGTSPRNILVQPMSGSASPNGNPQTITSTSSSTDYSSAHVASFGDDSALVTWQEIDNPDCGDGGPCTGDYKGTSFQQVDSDGNLVGSTFTSTDVTVSGNMVNLGNGRVCWPYVSINMTMYQAALQNTYQFVGFGPAAPDVQTRSISFACLSADGQVTTPSGSSTTSASAYSSTHASSTRSSTSSGSSRNSASTYSSTPAASTVPSASSESSRTSSLAHSSTPAASTMPSMSSESSTASASVHSSTPAASTVPSMSSPPATQTQSEHTSTTPLSHSTASQETSSAQSGNTDSSVAASSSAASSAASTSARRATHTHSHHHGHSTAGYGRPSAYSHVPASAPRPPTGVSYFTDTVVDTVTVYVTVTG